ncbi:MAG: amidohydrolase, partial [Gemmatimonadota bacterium]
LTGELADDPSWGADSRTITYQSAGRLRRVRVTDGRVDTIPLALTYRRSQPEGRVVVHAGRLFDGTSPELRRNVDVVVRGNRIERVVPHRAALHEGARRVVDASGRTVMPGLIEGHAHQPTSYGEALGRIWLAYGVTSVRNPASDAYEARERREAIAAGVRPGPRPFFT